MFENLSERLERSFKILKGEGKITEINVAETLKDVRRALLDADVNYKVAKTFTDIYETGVARLLDKARDGGGAKADIEDGIHHTRHGAAGAGAAAHEERIVRISELLAHDFLSCFQSGGHLGLELRGIATTQTIVLSAALGGNGETSGNRHSEQIHLGQVGTFAAQEFSHLSIAFGVLSAKAIDSFLNFCHKFIS